MLLQASYHSSRVYQMSTHLVSSSPPWHFTSQLTANRNMHNANENEISSLIRSLISYLDILENFYSILQYSIELKICATCFESRNSLLQATKIAKHNQGKTEQNGHSVKSGDPLLFRQQNYSSSIIIQNFRLQFGLWLK